MRIRNIDSIAKLLIGSKFIGRGHTGFCFLLPSGSIVKIYYNSADKREMFSTYKDNLINFLDFLSKFNDETFYGPIEVLVKKGNVIGYVKDLAIGKTLNHIKGNKTIDEIESMIALLAKNVESVSQNNLRLIDLHPKNIMYSYTFKIVDMDKCLRNTKHSYNDLVKYNMGDLLVVITKSLFKVKESHDIYFYNPNLNNLYQDSIYRDYEEYYDFLEYLRSYGNDLQELRRAGLHYSLVHKDYYSKF